MSDVRRTKTHLRFLKGSALRRASSQLLEQRPKLFSPSSSPPGPELPRTTRENPSRRQRLARARDQRSPEHNISRKRHLRTCRCIWTEHLLTEVCEHGPPSPFLWTAWLWIKKCDSFLSRSFNHQLLGNSRGSWQKTPGQYFHKNLKQMLFVFKKKKYKKINSKILLRIAKHLSFLCKLTDNTMYYSHGWGKKKSKIQETNKNTKQEEVMLITWWKETLPNY